MLSRRRALALGGCLTAIPVSGCTSVLSDPEYLSLELLNFDSKPHTIAVELLRVDADEHSDAAVLRERYELETPPEDVDRVASRHREDEILESDKYLVRVHLADAPATRATYHYYPDCGAAGDVSDELYIEVRTDREGTERYIDFQQNRCTESSGWF